uniref:Transmembrane protein n=1 Tax=Caenorhabditis tropicalis TaxID=1561998 RepID=A0A1I7UPU9_9PELO
MLTRRQPRFMPSARLTLSHDSPHSITTTIMREERINMRPNPNAIETSSIRVTVLSEFHEHLPIRPRPLDHQPPNFILLIFIVVTLSLLAYSLVIFKIQQ